MSVDAVHKAVHETLLQDSYDQYRKEPLTEFNDCFSFQEVLEFCGLKIIVSLPFEGGCNF